MNMHKAFVAMIDFLCFDLIVNDYLLSLLIIMAV